MCNWKSKVDEYYKCPEPALPDSEKGYCIFHAEQKDNTEYSKRIQEKLKNKDYNFTGYYFPRFTNFREITLEADVSFTEAFFNQDVVFLGTTFEGDASFVGATFLGRAEFQNTMFSRDTVFSHATFKGGCYFIAATFSRYADFSNATFNETADFRYVNFQTDTYFNRATFYEIAYFRKVTFNGNANFHNTIYERSLDFTNTRFKYLEDKELIYRIAKMGYEKDGQYDKAAECLYEEKIARWQQLKWKSRSFSKKLLERIFMWSTCGYGERPLRVVIWAFGIITICTILYNLYAGNICSVDRYDVFGFGDAIYMSGVTFVTLGFGGPWYPDPECWIKYIVMMEGGIGGFSMALFVTIFGRIMLR